VWQQLARWSDPLVAVAVSSPKADDERRWSLAESSNPNVHLTSLYRDDGQTLLRLFNASRGAGATRLRLAPLIEGAELVELDGRVTEAVPMMSGGGGLNEISVSLPRFGVRTIRLRHA